MKSLTELEMKLIDAEATIESLMQQIRILREERDSTSVALEEAIAEMKKYRSQAIMRRNRIDLLEAQLEQSYE